MEQLCDEQIEKLLLEAEQRLHSGSGSVAAPSKISRSSKISLDKDSRFQSTPRAEKTLTVRDAAVPVVSTEKTDSAGGNWFNMPKTTQNSEMKRDWQILRMRNILDPKHQRKHLPTELPNYSQVGEIIAGPTEFYSARLTKKEKKRTLLEEAMSTRDDVKMGTKYAGIQKKKASGKKAFYQKIVQQRRKGNT